MASKQRIGLRQVRALKPGETIWDASLAGFGAGRQRGNAVSYVLFYRTKEGRQRWFTIGRHGDLGRPIAHGRKPDGFWARLPTKWTLPPTRGRHATPKPFPNYATCTLPMP
jgi:hypothetical protein